MCVLRWHVWMGRTGCHREGREGWSVYGSDGWGHRGIRWSAREEGIGEGTAARGGVAVEESGESLSKELVRGER